MGTPTYMSPEQVEGLELDGRTDIYSLGVVAWEMLTGHRPWAGDSVEQVMYRQAHEALPGFAHYAIDVPPELARAIERALAKDRRKRWQSADELAAAVATATTASAALDGAGTDVTPHAERTPWYKPRVDRDRPDGATAGDAAAA